mmetsp:Transcript_117623/g.366404  ORF Transcript_117623/g.366404 Transcript_117623/m.366404 type:complete len:548 (+) Transcript_117623:3-1646(+)
MECSCCSLRPLRGLEGGLEPRILARQALGGLLHLFVADGHGVQLLLQLHHRGPELAALVLQVRSPLLQVLRELLGFRAQGPVLRLQSGHLVHHGEGGRLQRPLHEGLHLGAELLVLPPDLPQLRVLHADQLLVVVGHVLAKRACRPAHAFRHVELHHSPLHGALQLSHEGAETTAVPPELRQAAGRPLQRLAAPESLNLLLELLDAHALCQQRHQRGDVHIAVLRLDADAHEQRGKALDLRLEEGPERGTHGDKVHGEGHHDGRAREGRQGRRAGGHPIGQQLQCGHQRRGPLGALGGRRRRGGPRVAVAPAAPASAAASGEDPAEEVQEPLRGTGVVGDHHRHGGRDRLHAGVPQEHRVDQVQRGPRQLGLRPALRGVLHDLDHLPARRQHVARRRLQLRPEGRAEEGLQRGVLREYPPDDAAEGIAQRQWSGCAEHHCRQREEHRGLLVLVGLELLRGERVRPQGLEELHEPQLGRQVHAHVGKVPAQAQSAGAHEDVLVGPQLRLWLLAPTPGRAAPKRQCGAHQQLQAGPARLLGHVRALAAA